MPIRKSLHTMVDLLADYCVLKGRKITIEITDGTHIKWDYSPPIEDERIASAVAMGERESALELHSEHHGGAITCH